MDADQTIAEIECLEHICAEPDARPLSASDLSWIVCSVAAAFHGVLVFAGKVIAQSLGASVVCIRPGVVACGPPRPAATIVGSPKVRIEFDGLGVVHNRAVEVTFGALRRDPCKQPNHPA